VVIGGLVGGPYGWSYGGGGVLMSGLRGEGGSLMGGPRGKGGSYEWYQGGVGERVF